MILLDTNVLIDLHVYRLDLDEPFTASIVSRAELELGVRSARSLTAAHPDAPIPLAADPLPPTGTWLGSSGPVR